VFNLAVLFLVSNVAVIIFASNLGYLLSVVFALGGGSDHIAPDMTSASGYLAGTAAKLRAAVSVPLLVAGRINQPQDAELIIASGQADACVMTRAMIADPDMPRLAAAGQVDDIRACIGCNQACIGHFHLGLPISCIQHPETGREQLYAIKTRARSPRKVLVVGAGPAGMKAAAVAAERGHQVRLPEASGRVGGQVLLAQQLPGREEFGGRVGPASERRPVSPQEISR
jgi:NADPH-dependent 2,4-dienoyl-CoA reductase/sulfur reductase-like enzyme